MFFDIKKGTTGYFVHKLCSHLSNFSPPPPTHFLSTRSPDNCHSPPLPRPRSQPYPVLYMMSMSVVKVKKKEWAIHRKIFKNMKIMGQNLRQN